MAAEEPGCIPLGVTGHGFCRDIFARACSSLRCMRVNRGPASPGCQGCVGLFLGRCAGRRCRALIRRAVEHSTGGCSAGLTRPTHRAATDKRSLHVWRSPGGWPSGGPSTGGSGHLDAVSGHYHVMHTTQVLRTLGGRVLVGPAELPGRGRIVIGVDSTDARIGFCGTVALSQRASSARLKAAKQAPRSPWRTMTNRASQPCCRASGGADEARSSGLIGQCNSAPERTSQCGGEVLSLIDFIQLR